MTRASVEYLSTQITPDFERGEIMWKVGKRGRSLTPTKGTPIRLIVYKQDSHGRYKVDEDKTRDRGYVINVEGHMYPMHMLLYALYKGRWVKVGHKDGNKKNNIISNLKEID